MKLSQKGKIILCGLALLLFFFIIATLVSNSTDGAKFKREYEALNGKKTESGNAYQKLKLKKKNKIKYSTMGEIGDLVFAEESAIVYFGYPNCPWCRGMISTLLDVVGSSSVDVLYYVDMTDKRDTFEYVDGKLEKTSEASGDYYALLSIFDEYLDDYTILDGDGIEMSTGEKRIYLPFVAAIKDGIVVDAFVATVDLDEGQSPYDELSYKQKSELEVIFNNMLDAYFDEDACTGYC